ncbi:hypothetical protein O9H85_17445 [Paenibacillus filicis]|uniref:Uncharacterized protein n=1 Tax=Paenibacillus gyeongsangnamensis TaxID=3388067 RepID=A0ABT4QBB7_9BACL|nr:hypothetical protein [Paenibacillus filicis]MCZ8514179.1 hypothetical protein [Paenibacillus filicis]
MRYTVQYIPLSKLKPGMSAVITQRIKELRKTAQDCMHLMIVRKSKKEGGYVIVSGNNHYEYLKNHTKKALAPCLVDESKAASGLSSLLYRFRKRKLPYDLKFLKPERWNDNSWTIIRSFLRQEPRFRRLSRKQQVRVIWLGLRYKRTTVGSMKARVDQFIKNKEK